MDKSGCNRRVDTAGERADDFAIFDLLPYVVYALVDEAARRPGALTAAYPVQEVLNYGLPVRCMGDFRVELQPEDICLITYDCSRRVFSVRQSLESCRPFHYMVAVAHPHRYRGRQAGKERRGFIA